MPKKGQPSKFNTIKREAFLKLLREGGRRGASAEAIGVTRQIVHVTMKKEPKFAKAVNLAEMEAHELVEDALFQAALAGNVIAQQVYLYNRMPERWTDRRQYEHIGKPGEPIKIKVTYEGRGSKRRTERSSQKAS